MKKAQAKSIFLFLTIMLIALASVYALTVTINSPDDEWIDTSSVPFNFTYTVDGSSDNVTWCAILTNDNTTVSANYTTGLSNGTPFVSGIGFGDSVGLGYNWSIVCSDGGEQAGNGPVNFGVDSNLPTITLDGPVDGSYLDNTLFDLLFTPTDASNLQDCDLYTNLTGSWVINKTFPDVTSGVQNGTNVTGASDSEYFWNVNCNQTSTDRAWAEDANRTFIIDTTDPSSIAFVTTNNTFSSDTTPLIKWTKTTEINFEEYEVSVSTDKAIATIIQTKIITDITGNATTLNALAVNDSYFIIVTARDLAGNAVNTTSVLYYTIDEGEPTVTLDSPSNGTYTSDANLDFDVTVIDTNPDVCVLYLSNSSGQNVVINQTELSVISGTSLNLTSVGDMVDGNYKFNIGCNDTVDNRVNASSTLLDLIVDTTAPTVPLIVSTWHQTNSTDTTPTLTWTATTETYFVRYLVQALNYATGAIEYAINVTTKATVTAAMSLTAGNTYNFSVTAYDEAGSSTSSTNTTDTLYYVDEVCGILNTGWNLCGATWTTAKNLSDIGAETSANFISIYNSSKQWQTCNYAVSASGTNCNAETNIANGATSAVYVYVNESQVWRDRTWVADVNSANITLTNVSTNGWNLVGMFLRNGRTFEQLNASTKFSLDNNVTMYSLPYNNGSSMPYVTKTGFNTINKNTKVDYGRAMWIHYLNTSSTFTFDIGAW